MLEGYFDLFKKCISIKDISEMLTLDSKTHAGYKVKHLIKVYDIFKKNQNNEITKTLLGINELLESKISMLL